MSAPQFTPGPWRYGHLGTEALWIGPDYDQTTVATVEHDTAAARDNSRANANLIAAAPDGYAVGEKALAYLLPHAGDVEAAELIDEISAFLRKARGEQ